MSGMEFWELASYIVTVVARPSRRDLPATATEGTRERDEETGPPLRMPEIS